MEVPASQSMVWASRTRVSRKARPNLDASQATAPLKELNPASPARPSNPGKRARPWISKLSRCGARGPSIKPQPQPTVRLGNITPVFPANHPAAIARRVLVSLHLTASPLLQRAASETLSIATCSLSNPFDRHLECVITASGNRPNWLGEFSKVAYSKSMANLRNV
jgi:hypothetical protein